jgi:hypothetical protein
MKNTVLETLKPRTRILFAFGSIVGHAASTAHGAALRRTLTESDPVHSHWQNLIVISPS